MKQKINIVADKHIPFLKGVLDHVANISYLPWQEMTRERLHDADALITRTRTLCNEELLAGSKVKMIATATIGYDHIDTDYCDRNRIAWTNAPGCNSGSVEQYILSALISLASRKRISLAGMTIGIVGVGFVGSRVERIARALGMNVLLNDPPRARSEGPGQFVDLPVIIQEADIVTLHVPMNKEGADRTFHLADESFFDKLGKRAILINSSRGGVVDGAALKETIKKGQLEAVVLDVWEGEPGIDFELLNQVDIATPHIAGYSADGKSNGTKMSVQALSRFFHLGLDDWQTGEIPPPDHDQVSIDATGMRLQEIISEVVRQTYDIMRDDQSLRSDPESFEKLRAEYPVRREPLAYKIRIINDEAGAGEVLEKLRYQVLSDHCL